MFDLTGEVERTQCVDAIRKLFSICFDCIYEENHAWLEYMNGNINNKSVYLSKHRKSVKYIRIIEELGLTDLYLWWRDNTPHKVPGVQYVQYINGGMNK